MNYKHVVLPLAAGVATSLIVGIAVTAGLQPWIEFSALLGIPAGLVTGILAGAGVYLGLGPVRSPRRRRIAGSAVWFAVVFLATLAVGAGPLQYPLSSTIGVAVVVGVFGAVGTYFRRSSAPSAVQT